MHNTPIKLREDILWKKVYKLAEHIYSLIDDLIANAPSEEWNSAAKLRNASSDSLFFVSQVVGSASPEINKYDLSNARKNLFAVQSMYTFAAKQKFIDMEPEIIVEIDSILTDIDQRIITSEKELEKKNKEELEPWMEKYRLWQKMQG